MLFLPLLFGKLLTKKKSNFCRKKQITPNLFLYFRKICRYFEDQSVILPSSPILVSLPGFRTVQLSFSALILFQLSCNTLVKTHHIGLRKSRSAHKNEVTLQAQQGNHHLLISPKTLCKVIVCKIGCSHNNNFGLLYLNKIKWVSFKNPPCLSKFPPKSRQNWKVEDSLVITLLG